MTTRPRTQWSLLKKHSPKTPDEFMAIVYAFVPGITENDVMAWQRSMTVQHWERDLCDFIWQYMQYEREPKMWQASVHQHWPNIQQIMDTQNLEDAFAGWSI
jgi:hypothetical protein